MKHNLGEGRCRQKIKDPADKALARMTHATSCFGTRAIPPLPPFFRALQSSSKSLADGYLFVLSSPDNSTLADRGHGSSSSSIGIGTSSALSAQLPDTDFVGHVGIRACTCPIMQSSPTHWHRPGSCSFPWDLLIFAAPRASFIPHR